MMRCFLVYVYGDPRALHVRTPSFPTRRSSDLELTCRQVGEGTGRSRDLDAFDPHYQHIVVWDAAAMRSAGAYRVARGAQVLARAGLAGLYTADRKSTRLNSSH